MLKVLTLSHILLYKTPWKSDKVLGLSSKGWFYDTFGLGFLELCLYAVILIVIFALGMTKKWFLPASVGLIFTIFLFVKGHWIIGILSLVITFFASLGANSMK